MTSSFGFEPVDGPPPLPPKYGLLQAAAIPGSAVRLIPEVDETGTERWGNGVAVWPYPAGLGEVHKACASGSDITEKGYGDDQPVPPEFEPLVVTFAETCTAASVATDEAFRDRAVAALAAIEGPAIEREFLTGARIPANPNLSDGNGSFPNGDNVTSLLNGLALLEGEIARSGRMGVIHLNPMHVPFLLDKYALFDVGGVLRTGNGITVIPGFGYVDGANPLDGHAEAAGWENWIYATGPIDIRRSPVVMIPDTLSEALDRGLGATDGRPNTITYIAERYYVVDWDTAVQAAVLVDRCTDSCGDAPS